MLCDDGCRFIQSMGGVRMPDEILLMANESLRRQLSPLNENNVTTARWTDTVVTVLNGLCAQVATRYSAPLDLVLAFHNRAGVPGGKSEFMLDFTLATYPIKYTLESPPSAESIPRILLAAESEWGKENSRPENYSLVFDDFCKLVEVRSPLKILVYGFHQVDRKRYIKDFLTILNGRSIDLRGEQWLLFGVPWDAREFVSDYFTPSS